MKHYLTLLATGLCGISIAHAQTTTTGSSVTATNPSYISPVTTDSTNATRTGTNATTPSGTSYGNSSDLNSSGGATNSTTPGTYGTTTTSNTYRTNNRGNRANDYKNFVFGLYAGLNTTRFAGEDVNGDRLTGRLGYQAGFFVRGGGRLYGQLGAEYFASSSNYFTAGSGTSAAQIRDQINIQYIQIPAFIGYKLVESDRGISAVRLQVGLEYANRIKSNSGDFNLTNAELKSGTFNGLGQLGFDAGPVFLDLTYHYGFSNAINAVNTTGFASSQRRILSASVGFKF